MIQAALALLFLLLPLGTTPMEGATILLAGAAVLSPRRATQPLLGPALAVWAVLLLAEVQGGPGGLWAASLGAWAWALLVLAPPTLAALTPAQRRRIEHVGLGAAAIAGVWALVEVGLAGQAPWVSPVDGPFSHHLTLGYALLPPLARALWTRRWWAALPIALGVACAGASGPLLSGAVLLGALVLPPAAALGLGAVAAIAAVALLSGDAELTERVVLWTAGADVAVAHPHGAGLSGVRDATALAQADVAPGFHFPLHAHDSALQAAAEAGWATWAAGAWALVALWRVTDRAGRAAVAAVVVGGLTQDTLGDLEVTRALCAWAILGAAPALAAPNPDRHHRHTASDEPDGAGAVGPQTLPEVS